MCRGERGRRSLKILGDVAAFLFLKIFERALITFDR